MTSKQDTRRLIAMPNRACAELRNGSVVPLVLKISSRTEPHTVFHEIQVCNPHPQTLPIHRIELRCHSLPCSTIEVFRQGFFMPSDSSGFYLLKAGADTPAAGYWKPAGYSARDFVSHGVAVVKFPGRTQLMLAGFTSFDRFDTWFRFDTRRPQLRLAVVFEIGVPLKAGETLRLESLLETHDSSLRRCLDRYTKHVAHIRGARVPRRTVTGWIDWQYYREAKNERDILRTVTAMKTLVKRGYPLKTIVVDGGWCAYASEWRKACDKFPNMRKLSQRLRRDGFELGIWLAPYITNIKTEVARRHSDWMVIDEKTGAPLHKPSSNVGPCYILDFTVPAALEWLRSIVRMMVRDWRIGYLKLDGPSLAHYRGGRFHHPDQTAIEQVRRSLQVIREECGDTVIVEGEGVYGPSIGYVDTQRTTQDNHPMWRNPNTGASIMKENLKNDLLSAFLHGRFWHNHRENVVLRDFSSPFASITALNPAIQEPILTRNELQFQLSAAVMAGGAMLLADPMDQLLRDPAQERLISQFLPHYECRGCYPVDVFQGGRTPSIYCLPVERPFESWLTIGVFNWDDVFANFDVPLRILAGNGAWHAYDFWNMRYLGRHTNRLRVPDVPAHGCRILAVRRVLARPQMIGNNLHILQGAVDVESQTWQNRQLNLVIHHFDQRDRKLVVHYPNRFRFQTLKTDARDHLIDTRRPNLIAVHFNGRRRTTFEFNFAL